MFPFPKEWISTSAQASMVSPMYSNVDGKVWTNNQEDSLNYRLDLATGKFENPGQAKTPGGKQIRAYGMPTDRQNNLYQLEFGGQSIGRRDAKTLEVTIWPTATALSRPRRGRVDEQNRLWFAEYGGNGIGMFDPKTDAIKEWQLPTPWSAPYDVVAIKNGAEVWTGSMLTDRVSRLDTATGEVVDYLLPRTTNIRRVFVDETGRAAGAVGRQQPRRQPSSRWNRWTDMPLRCGAPRRGAVAPFLGDGRMSAPGKAGAIQPVKVRPK